MSLTYQSRIRGSELRQLGSLLAALLKDRDLMPELSVMEEEHLQTAAETVRRLLPLAEARDLEDSLNES
jgi:hypothetical protein